MSANTVYQYTRPGRLSETLERSQRPIPSPGDNEVVIRIKAISINPVDNQLSQAPTSLLRFLGASMPNLTPDTPWIPAADFAGVIHQAGRDSGWKEGEEIYGMKPVSVDGKGTLQQYLLLDKSAPVARKPPELSFPEAAATPLVYTTVHDALVKWGKLPFDPPPNEVGKRSVLILGGSSGTGHVAIQLGKKMGLRVVTTCSTRNVSFVKSLGADEVIDYTQEHVPEAALMSPYAPFAVILDCVGGTEMLGHLDYLLLEDRAAPQLGIYITIVGDKTGRDAMGGAVTNYYYPSQMIRTLRGRLNDSLPNWIPFKSWIAGKRYACINLEPSQAIMASVPQFIADGRKVVVDTTWKFENVRKAYEKLESGRAVGKVVIEVD